MKGVYRSNTMNTAEISAVGVHDNAKSSRVGAFYEGRAGTGNRCIFSSALYHGKKMTLRLVLNVWKFQFSKGVQSRFAHATLSENIST